MFYKIINAYKENDIDLHVGNNNTLCALIAKDGKPLLTGGGISITDIAFFFGLSKIFKPSRIFCIGNASGYGTFVLAEIFDCPIDAIDSETEGPYNLKGSEITRKISKDHYNNRVKLYSGSSPMDLSQAINENKYDFIFVDGKHTNEQQKLDFDEMQQYTNQSCIFYMHDVAMCNMEDGFKQLKIDNQQYSGYSIDFTTFGCKAMVRELPIVENWLKLLDTSPVDDWKNPKPYVHFK
jgi:predicted O-methyltransferase YrrM